jgi:2-polyprenyl-6-methoxyphenol hydroxylase-like FAD-dependent oxidoreductase
VNIALAPNAVRVLQRMGVYHTLRAQGCTYEKLAVSNSCGKELGSLLHGSERYYNYSALRVHRAKVQRALFDEAKTQGIDVNFGMKLTDLEEGTKSVSLIFANGQTAEADLVVGADGVYSKVRPHVVDCELEYSGFMGIIAMDIDKATLRESARTTHFPNFCYGQTGFVAMMPANVDATELDFFSTMPAPARSQQEWDDLASNPAELQKIVQGRFGQGWPEHIMGVAQEHPKEQFALYP